MEGIEYFIYMSCLLVSLPFVYQIVTSLRLEEIFKKGKIWQIKSAYFILTIIISHFLATFFEKITSIFL